jgi:TetR/AcrR family transcriptional regulator, transcriptional repressor for nem operon
MTGHMKFMAKARSADIREKLLEAGVGTIRKAGFNGCSVQDITDAAGVPKGSFYNYFESKEALAAAALEYNWNSGSCDQLRILSDASVPPRTRLARYFERMTGELAALNFTCGCLAGNMAAELSDQSKLISDQLALIFNTWTRRVADCIAEAQARGEIAAKADPEILAKFVLNAWEGAVLRARIDKNDRSLKQFLDVLFGQLLR